MLTSLSLTNFKAWKRIDKMRLAPITALFGTNSSGKSSILQFLLMLKQTADSSDRSVVIHLGDDKTPVNLGTFSDAAHAHSEKPEFKIGVEWTTARPLDIKDPDTQNTSLCKSDNLSFTSTVLVNGSGKLTVPEMKYGLGETSFGLSKSDSKEGYQLSTTAHNLKFRRAEARRGGTGVRREAGRDLLLRH